MDDRRKADIAALLLRLGLGTMFLAHGLLMKVMTNGPAGTYAYFEKIGYPGFFAYLVIAGEVLGGLALLLGFRARWVALALIPIMVGATLQHAGNGWGFSKPGGGWEFPAFWTLCLVVQSLLGSGLAALDGHPLARRLPLAGRVAPAPAE